MEIIFTKAFLLFFGIGIVGMISHWAKRWLRQQTKANLYEYLFVNNPKYTASAFLAYVGAILVLVFGGHTDFESTQALGLAYATGYGIDSALNKDIEDDEIHVRVRDSYKSGE